MFPKSVVNNCNGSTSVRIDAGTPSTFPSIKTACLVAVLTIWRGCNSRSIIGFAAADRPKLTSTSRFPDSHVERWVELLTLPTGRGSSAHGFGKEVVPMLLCCLRQLFPRVSDCSNFVLYTSSCFQPSPYPSHILPSSWAAFPYKQPEQTHRTSPFLSLSRRSLAGISEGLPVHTVPVLQPQICPGQAPFLT